MKIYVSNGYTNPYTLMKIQLNKKDNNSFFKDNEQFPPPIYRDCLPFFLMDVFLFCFSSSCCQFLWIIPLFDCPLSSVFSNLYWNMHVKNII